MDIAPLGVRLAKTAGFCMGVKRAVDLALDMSRQKRYVRVCSYGPLIHNPQTMELLKAQGITVLNDLESVKGEDVLIIIRAHGIAPEEKQRIRDLGYEVLDATCPRVAHVQAIIRKHSTSGYDIVIVGDPDHPEVNGLMGYAEGRGTVISNREGVLRLSDANRLCVVAQTTQDVLQYNEIIEDIKLRHHDALFFDTICDSTAQRQQEVSALAQEMEAMIVVGGKNSANTRRLAELSEREGADTFHIETAPELDDRKMRGYKKIGISAGASTPNWIIDQVMDRVVATHRRGNVILWYLLRFWVWLIKNDIYAAFGAAALALTGTVLIGAKIKAPVLLAASLYVYGMHTLNRYINYRISGGLGSHRDTLQAGQGGYRFFISLAAITASMLISSFAGSESFLLLLAITFLGVLYHVPIFPAVFRFRSIKDIPGSKNISMALAWSTVAVILPYQQQEGISLAAVGVSFAFVFYIVFSRSVISDIWDIQSDRLKGHETMPVVMGIAPVRRLVVILSIPILLMVIAAGLAALVSGASFYLSICLFYVWICAGLCDRALNISNFVMEGLLETNYLLAGLVTLIWLYFS